MNQYIYADPSPFNITITFNFYDKRQQIVRRTFTLRNLQGSSEAAQLAHATTIMNDVAPNCTTFPTAVSTKALSN
jgi:hypothetical protein